MTTQSGKGAKRIFPGSSSVLEPTAAEYECMEVAKKDNSVDENVKILMDQSIYAPK